MKSINRRKAINYLYKAIAGSTGVFVFGVNANSQKPLKKKSTQKTLKQKPKINRNRAIMKKTLDEELKAIKVLLENNRRVFTNEYGRITPVVTKPASEIDPDGAIPGDLGNLLSTCAVNFNFGLEQGINWCTSVNTCNGQDLPGTSDDDQGCHGTNTCNGQTCGHFHSCDTNKCRNQSCPELWNCDKNKQKIVPSCVADLLDQYRTDPYVELLFQEFNVTNSTELVNMLEVRVDAIVQEVR